MKDDTSDSSGKDGFLKSNVDYYSEKAKNATSAASNYAKQVISNPAVTDKANQVKDIASNLWKSSTSRLSIWGKNSNDSNMTRQISSSEDDFDSDGGDNNTNNSSSNNNYNCDKNKK